MRLCGESMIHKLFRLLWKPVCEFLRTSGRHCYTGTPVKRLRCSPSSIRYADADSSAARNGKANTQPVSHALPLCISLVVVAVVLQLQSPHSFNQSMQELLITLERSGDPAGLSILKPHFEKLSGIDAMPLERDSSNASPEIEKTTTSVAKATDTSFNWTASCLQSACIVTLHLMQFLSQYSSGHFRPTNGSPSASFLPSARHVVACDRGPVLQSPSPFASRGKRPGPRNMRSPDPSFT